MTDVALRDHLEKLIALQVEQIQERFEAMEHARVLQATEYERRLTELNHAHERAIAEQRRTLPRETWETWKKDDYELFKAHTTKTLQVAATKAATWLAALGLAMMALGLMLPFLLKLIWP